LHIPASGFRRSIRRLFLSWVPCPRVPIHLLPASLSPFPAIVSAVQAKHRSSGTSCWHMVPRACAAQCIRSSDSDIRHLSHRQADRPCVPCRHHPVHVLFRSFPVSPSTAALVSPSPTPLSAAARHGELRQFVVSTKPGRDHILLLPTDERNHLDPVAGHQLP